MKQGKKPMYVVSMGTNVGFYKGSSPYQPVPRDEAEQLTHKRANVIEGKLRRLGYKGASMEALEK